MLDTFSRFVTRHYLFIVISITFLGLGLAVAACFIEIDPSIKSFVLSYQGKEQLLKTSKDFQNTYDITSDQWMILLKGSNVVSVQALQYIHDLSKKLKANKNVQQLISPTNMLWPKAVVRSEETQEVPTLDQLEEELDIEEDVHTDVIDALITLCTVNPQRCNGGFVNMGPVWQQALKQTQVFPDENVRPKHVKAFSKMLEYTHLMEGRLISKDRQVIGLSFTFHETKHMKTNIKDIMSDIRPPPKGFDVYIGGMPYLEQEIIRKIEQDQTRLLPLTCFFCIIMLFLFLRRFAFVLLPMIVAALTGIIMIGVMALFNKPLTVLSNLVPVLLIIIGLSDSIHFLSRYKEEKNRYSKKEAIERTICYIGPACLLTSLTTAASFGSLALSHTLMIRDFGIIAAAGVMVAYALTMTFLPAMLKWIRLHKNKQSTAGKHENSNSSWMKTIMETSILKRSKLILGVTCLVSFAGAFVSKNIVSDHSVFDQFQRDDPALAATHIMEDQLQGVYFLEVDLLSLQKGRFYDIEILSLIDKLEIWARSQPEVITTFSQNHLLKETLHILEHANHPQKKPKTPMPFQHRKEVIALKTIMSMSSNSTTLDKWVNKDRSRARIQINLRSISSKQTLDFLARLKQKLKSELAPYKDLDAAFAGDAYTTSIGTNAVIQDFFNTLVLSFACIFFLLFLLIRKLKIVVLSLLSSVIPMIFTMAYMVYRDMNIDVSSALIFSLTLGLAVDGSIHLLSRFLQETVASKTALLHATISTAKPILVSYVTLIGGFSVLLTSHFSAVHRFGELLIITMILCIFSTLLVQPALLHIGLKLK